MDIKIAIDHASNTARRAVMEDEAKRFEEAIKYYGEAVAELNEIIEAGKLVWTSFMNIQTNSLKFFPKNKDADNQTRITVAKYQDRMKQLGVMLGQFKTQQQQQQQNIFQGNQTGEYQRGFPNFSLSLFCFTKT